MIKAEKTGNKMELTITGGSHDLICEFDEVLKAMYKVLDESVVKSAPFTAEDILHTMAHNAVAEGKENRRKTDLQSLIPMVPDTAFLPAGAGVSEQNGSRTSQLYMEALLIGWVLMKTLEVLKN